MDIKALNNIAENVIRKKLSSLIIRAAVKGYSFDGTEATGSTGKYYVGDRTFFSKAEDDDKNIVEDYDNYKDIKSVLDDLEKQVDALKPAPYMTAENLKWLDELLNKSRKKDVLVAGMTPHMPGGHVANKDEDDKRLWLESLVTIKSGGDMQKLIRGFMSAYGKTGDSIGGFFANSCGFKNEEELLEDENNTFSDVAALLDQVLGILSLAELNKRLIVSSSGIVEDCKAVDVVLELGYREESVEVSMNEYIRRYRTVLRSSGFLRMRKELREMGFGRAEGDDGFVFVMEGIAELNSGVLGNVTLQWGLDFAKREVAVYMVPEAVVGLLNTISGSLAFNAETRRLADVLIEIEKLDSMGKGKTGEERKSEGKIVFYSLRDDKYSLPDSFGNNYQRQILRKVILNRLMLKSIGSFLAPDEVRASVLTGMGGAHILTAISESIKTALKNVQQGLKNGSDSKIGEKPAFAEVSDVQKRYEKTFLDYKKGINSESGAIASFQFKFKGFVFFAESSHWGPDLSFCKDGEDRTENESDFNWKDIRVSSEAPYPVVAANFSAFSKALLDGTEQSVKHNKEKLIAAEQVLREDFPVEIFQQWAEMGPGR